MAWWSAKPPTLRDITRDELDALINEHCSTSALTELCSTQCWEGIRDGVAVDGPYAGEFVTVANGIVLTRLPIPKKNGK